MMDAARSDRKPRMAVWKFASCDGCQLSLLDCEEELLTLAEEVEIAYFLEASSSVAEGPYDLSLVDGSITTPLDVERIHRVRDCSKYLVTIGTCATSGGVQALRNLSEVSDYLAAVYPVPAHIDTLPQSTPISSEVPVDFQLQGCPINKKELLEVIGAFLVGRRPVVSSQSVCVQCKMNGTVCVMVADGIPCLGPVTHAGCGALCPAYHRGCYGCFGPKETPNLESLTRWVGQLGMAEEDIVRALRTFYAWAEPFRSESRRHDRHDQ